MKRGLIVTLCLAIGLWVMRKPLRQRLSSRVEKREGILVQLEVPFPKGPPRPRAVSPGTHCVLVHDYTPTGTSDLDQREDRYWSSDGLEASFCEANEPLRNHRLRVIGVRTSGEAIEQDCNNRACFEAVTLAPLEGY